MPAPVTHAAPAAQNRTTDSFDLPPQAQVIALDDFSDTVDRASTGGKTVINLADSLRNVRTTLQVCVGSVSLTVGELMGVVERQVIVLDRGVHQPVDIMLEGQVVARGQLVAVGDQFAVRITELPVPLGLTAPAAP
ncbi:FliM/FliN family flagellar motor switch protein [Xylophilus sp. ASV27]|uniref:FliM/FliN family flagellar motor switch protein n=1 Tax=Xylophilus sp. ASV27 TaxID=2795129 RepID=UPI0018ECA3F5|nr:FliM/FliN family flagellar motor switch protein [Xylophilus sp. ASV27]